MFEYFVNTKCYWFIILILSLENDYQMVPRHKQDYFKDNNMFLGKSKVEPPLVFENSQSVSNSDTQEFSLSSSTIKTTMLIEIVNSWILICKTEVENYDIRYTVKWCKKIKRENEQPSRGVLVERCSGNMQQIYRRTHMLKCDFNKVTNHTSAWVFSCKLAYF